MLKRIDAINVIPFIDIMLVLLAIVLTTATFIVEGRLDIALPRADGEAPSTKAAPVEIAIDRAGALFLDAEPIALPALEERLDALPQTTPVQLRVDRAAAFGGFVEVIELLKQRGLEQVSITVARP